MDRKDGGWKKGLVLFPAKWVRRDLPGDLDCQWNKRVVIYVKGTSKKHAATLIPPAL